MAKQYGPWQVQGTTTLFENDFFKVREDKVLKPNGQPGKYATVKMIKGVAILPIDEEGQVHLVSQFRYAIGQDSVETISGGIEDGEEPLEAAKREAREELGIVADEYISMGHMNIDTSMINGPVHLFVAKGILFTETERESTENISRIKVSLDEAIRMVMESRITHGPSCTLILKAAQAKDILH